MSYILEHFDQKARRHAVHSVDKRRLRGLNSILATEPIATARDYYAEFARQQEALPADRRSNIGIIYPYAPNAKAPGDSLQEESVDPGALFADDRTSLSSAIDDHNRIFGTNHDTSAHGFEGYYEAIAKSLTTRKIDLVIVVNMLLTGFGSKTLNTLWVDKNLCTHGLIQAFSRTNRVLNAVKSYGNIVYFRNLKEEVDEVIALFGSKDGGGSFLIRPYLEYLGEYIAAAEETRAYPQDQLTFSEEEQKAFITLSSKLLRLKNILTSFDEFAEDNPMEPRKFDDYEGIYVDLYSELRPTIGGEKAPINDDLVFGIELVKQVQANVDYIIHLVEEHKALHGDAKDRETLTGVSRIINTSPLLYSRRDLIEAFLKSFTLGEDGGTQWEAILEAAKRVEIDEIISAKHLHTGAARNFVARALECGCLPADGTEILKILLPISRFTKPSEGESRAGKKTRVITKLKIYLERFLGV